MIPLPVPNFVDKILFAFLRQFALMAIQKSDILIIGETINDLPSGGLSKFFYATTEDQLFFYTGNTSVGVNGWKPIG